MSNSATGIAGGGGEKPTLLTPRSTLVTQHAEQRDARAVVSFEVEERGGIVAQDGALVAPAEAHLLDEVYRPANLADKVRVVCAEQQALRASSINRALDSRLVEGHRVEIEIAD